MEMNTVKVIDKKLFLQMLEEKKTKHRTVNRYTKGYIDRWVTEHYLKACYQLSAYSFYSVKGKSSIDRFNDAIEELYFDNSLLFKTLEEANAFLDNCLCWKRFTITLRIY